MWNHIDLESEIRSERLVLTPVRRKHAEKLFHVLNDLRLHELTGGIPLSFDELRSRLAIWERRTSPDGRELWLNWIAHRLSDRHAVGHLQATVFGPRATLAWVIGSRWQGNGYGTEAAATVEHWLFEKLGAEEVVAHIHPDHVASERVATRIGLALTEEVTDGERVWRLANPSL